MMSGWIKLHRILKDKPIWRNSTPEQKSILITLLLMANHEEREWDWGGKHFKVLPGQFVTSLESIRQEAGKGISIKNIRSAIERFKKFGFLAYESSKSGRLITICSWVTYQHIRESNGQSNGQRDGKEVATNNKGNKPIRKELNKFIYPSLEEFTEYFSQNGYPIELASRAFKGYDEAKWHDSQGKQIKSWKQKCQHVWFKSDNKVVAPKVTNQKSHSNYE